MPGLLDGVRVVEFSQLIAAPLCALTLADLGADVVKVESPHGDYTRTWAEPGSESAIFHMLNRGKRGVVADHRDAAGRELARRLADAADIVLENHGDAMAATFGFGYDDVAPANPGLIWCSVSGLGAGAGGRAIDMTLQASMGVTALTGERDGPPLRGAMPFVDLMTGMYGAQSILAAVLQLERGGDGAFLDCAMVDAAATLTASPGALSLSGFSTPRRMGSENDLFVPSKVFETADGAYVHVVALSQGHWRGICTALGRPDLFEDPRFASNTERLAHRAEIHGELAEELRKHPADRICTEVTQAGGFCERVREIEEAWADPVIRERGLLCDSERLGFPLPVASLVRDRGPTRPAPLLGEHTAELERELGQATRR